MPPKIKITKDDIIQTTLSLIKEQGVDAINARAIATALQCSTQPIFSNFASMDDLQASLVMAAYDIYVGFIQNEVQRGEYPTYKAYGMAYIRFAKEEKELFKLLFMCDRTHQSFTPTADFEASVSMIMNANGITKEKAELMHLEMWACVHGIGTMMATSFLSIDWELVSLMLTDIYQGLRAKHLSKEV